MGRGPSYPYVNLEEAIGLARKMYDYAKRAPAQVDAVVTQAWKYSSTSSSGQKVLAALKAFGLIEDIPGSNGKSIKLTQRSVRILLDEESSQERVEEIKRAALSPRWYEFCWRNWGKDLPQSMRSNLLIEHGFVESTVDGFLQDYRKTINYAGLLEDRARTETKNGPEESLVADGPQIGDYVQWEANGTLRLAQARKLTHFSEDGKYAFVEGSNTGIPYSELIREKAPDREEHRATVDSHESGSSVSPQIAQISPKKSAVEDAQNILRDSFSLPNGTAVKIEWPSAFTPEVFEDFSDWLELIKRKVGRTVVKLKPEHETET